MNVTPSPGDTPQPDSVPTQTTAPEPTPAYGLPQQPSELFSPVASGAANPYSSNGWGAPAGASQAAPGESTSGFQPFGAPTTIGADAADAAAREAERQARNRQLGTVTPPSEHYVPEPPAKADTDKPLASLGLLLLRLITAGVVGIRAYQMLTRHDDAVARLVERGAPSPEIIAWVEAGVIAVIAVLLLIGFGTRTAAFLLAAAAIANIVFMQWGAFDLFRAGVEGIRGDFELLLAAIGLALLVLGSGGWAIDGIRRGAKARKSVEY
jgi:uncharacterized membrane protein YphA (DoxX/SURF4 family)